MSAPKLRVLLVKPPQHLAITRHLNNFLHLEPLDLEIVAGGVPEGGEAEILDLSLEADPREAFRVKLTQLKPHILGLGGYSNNSAEVKALAAVAKTIAPDMPVVVGGIHATIDPADYAIPQIDVIVRGEGGSVFREICRRAMAGEPLAYGAAALDHRAPDFKELALAPPPAFPELCEVPRPRRDLVRRDKYFSVWTAAPEDRKLKTMYPRIASVRTSYGCKFNCSFCVVHFVMGRKYVERTPEDVVDEIAALKEDYVYFVDDETFLNEARLTEIARLLKERGVRKNYVSWARADTIVRRPELFKLWKQIGLSIVYVGLEAMDEARLKEYNKKTTVETNRKAVAILREIGITLHASFMVNPDFTVEDFETLERTIKEVSPAEITFTVFSPSPGTELWRQTHEKFICPEPYLFYDCMHTLLPTRLPLGRFYAHFAKLYRIAWSANPLRVNGIKAPFGEVLRAIVNGTRYIFALRAIQRDYRK